MNKKIGIDKNVVNNSQPLAHLNNLYSIRRCTVHDLEGVIAVNERELPEDYPYFFYKNILDNFGDAFLVAVSPSNEIIGYIMWRVEKTPSLNSLRLIHKGHLVSIAVDSHHRRKGIATALLTYSMPIIKKYNISEYVLEVRVSNQPAINLYKKFNFQVHSIKKCYYRDGENAYYMIKKVS